MIDAWEKNDAKDMCENLEWYIYIAEEMCITGAMCLTCEMYIFREECDTREVNDFNWRH